MTNEGEGGPGPEEDASSTGEPAGLPIAEVSRQLGVPMPTLRSWELRYGIPPTERLPGKHRRYTPSELHALRLMRDEIARGKRARLAAEEVRELLGMTGQAADHVAAVLDASGRADAEAVRDQLDRARRAMGLGPGLDDVLLPAMRQVGLWWQTGRCTVETEYLTTEAARAWLAGLDALAPLPSRPAGLVLACGPTDQHTLGLEALSVLLRHEGWSCHLLGARVAVPDLVEAVRETDAGAVVVVSQLSTGRAAAVQSLRAAEREGVRAFYGGNTFSAPRSRRHVPDTFLGTRLQEASELIASELA